MWFDTTVTGGGWLLGCWEGVGGPEAAAAAVSTTKGLDWTLTLNKFEGEATALLLVVDVEVVEPVDGSMFGG